jgi:hypothetical protein
VSFPGVTTDTERDLGAVNTRNPHPRRFRALAAVLGPQEVAALALTLPSLETDELARILLTALPADERSHP